MDIKKICEDYKSGIIDENELEEIINGKYYEDLGYAKVDYDRRNRCGAQEVIFCQGKAVEHVVGIVESMLARKAKNILLSRANREVYKAVAHFPNTNYYANSRVIIVNEDIVVDADSDIVLIVTGGTADIAVADEAYHTLRVSGINAKRLYDVGVAGIHRLLANTEMIREASVIIAVAGMEGALASVVTGLASAPVIAVPTSVGYGASFNGLAALLSMLNSCSSGSAVVNIDNGFGAAMMAARIINAR